MREQTQATLAEIGAAVDLSTLEVEGTKDIVQFIGVLEDEIYSSAETGFQLKLQLQPDESKGITKDQVAQNSRKIGVYSAKINQAIESLAVLIQKREEALFLKVAPPGDSTEAMNKLVELRALLQTYLDTFLALATAEAAPMEREKARGIMQALEQTLNEAILGQAELIHHVVIALFAGGHVLLDGDPGRGKTSLAKSLAASVALKFRRLQCTSDLQPADILGDHEREGKVFTNILLMDEINRLPPKTLSALLEAMQEGTVTNGEARALLKPFFVMATQNHEESAGTYPVPDAVMDRFLFMLKVEMPEQGTLASIIQNALDGKLKAGELDALADVHDVRSIQKTAEKIPSSEEVDMYAAALALNTHPSSTSLELVRKYVEKSNETRGSIALIRAAKTQALLEGHLTVSHADVQAVAHAALRHRITLNFEAQAAKVSVDMIIDAILKETPMGS